MIRKKDGSEPELIDRSTATLRAHDGDNGVGEAAFGELHLLDEILKSFHIELAVGVYQLRGTGVFLHRRLKISPLRMTPNWNNLERPGEEGGAGGLEPGGFLGVQAFFGFL